MPAPCPPVHPVRIASGAARIAIRLGTVLVVTTAITSSCGAEPEAGSETFASHVAEIIYTSCTPCHRPGETAPFSLLDFDDVYKRREQIVEVTGDRLMPPWLPDHGDFLDDRRLSEEQIAMLRRWVDAGAPRGDRSQEPPCPEFVAGWQLGEPDLVVSVQQELVMPADGPDEFRNYVVPVGLPSGRYVSAVEIRPGSPAVHHAVLCVDRSDGSRRRDAADSKPGYGGMDLAPALPPDGYFLGWTPGKRVRRAPKGMAWTLHPGSDLVLQLHLTPTGKEERLRPRIALYFTDEPPTVVSYPLCLSAKDIDLPPGAADTVITDQFVTPVPVHVHSIYPHAHYLCSNMAAWATLPSGERRDLFRIERWDFDWQDDYLYREPIALPAGTRIEFEYHYDNSAANPANPFDPPQRVRLGDRSIDEMGNLTLQLVTVDHDARRTLGEAGVRRDLEKFGYDGKLLLQLAVLMREGQRLEEAIQAIEQVRSREPNNADALRELGICCAASGNAKAAEQAFTECLRLDASQNVARIQLGSLLVRSGRFAEGIQHYEAALSLDPKMAGLHNNLATAFLATNNLVRAEQHFEMATSLNPTIFQAWFNLGRVFAATGRKAPARAALQRALQLRPTDARALQALRQLGN